MSIPELLAPAGDKECAIYAISAGADAVYLGLQAGSARAGAKNFTFEELNETLRYAHERGCRVYLALNILENDVELDETAERAVRAANLGVDAVIVQDLGLARTLIEYRNRGILPETTQIHASTQMSVCTPEGAETLRKMGFDRLITAREMSLSGLKALSDTGLPVECFVHGALCMSFSGQCLMSSYIGGRSGNRGTCAQPCRMEYILRGGDGKAVYSGHLLSPDDFCGLALLDKICGTGVCSLKIEGRLKSPQYVAGVTRIYRKALDYVRDEKFGDYITSEEYKNDTEELKLLFCRGNFTEGYLNGKLTRKDITVQSPGRKGLPAGELTDLPKEVRIKGADCVFAEIRAKLKREVDVNDGVTVMDENYRIITGGTVSKVQFIGDKAVLLLAVGDRLSEIGDWRAAKLRFYITYKDKLMRELDRYNGSKEIKKCNISMRFTARKGVPASLTVSDGHGHTCRTVSDNPVSDAKSAPMTEESVSKFLRKTGDTPFEVTSIDFDMDSGLFMTAGEINAMRRNALSEILRERGTFRPRYSEKKELYESENRTELRIGRGNTLYFYKSEDFLNSEPAAIEKIAPKIIYLPIDLWLNPEKAAEAACLSKRYGALLFPAMPYIPIGGEYDGIDSLIKRAAEDADGFLLTNLGDFGLIRKNTKRADLILAADSSMNVTNSKTAEELAKLGAGIIAVSPESLRDGKPPEKVPEGTFYETISEGPVTLMRTRYCLLAKGREHCGACSDINFEIEDTKGVRYSIITKTRDCQNIILSPESFKYSKKDAKNVAFTRIMSEKELKL